MYRYKDFVLLLLLSGGSAERWSDLGSGSKMEKVQHFGIKVRYFC